MNTPELSPAEPVPAVRSRRRPPFRALVQVLRRGHLYAGLLMLPWVLLYGLTAFLFNHPMFLPDAPYVGFDGATLADTPMAAPPAPTATAAEVVAALQARAKPGVRYALVEPEKARYIREVATVTVRSGGRDVTVSFDLSGAGGTVRSRPPAPKSADPAPFAVPERPAGKAGPGGPRASAAPREGVRLNAPLHERALAAAPVVLERTGFPAGEVMVSNTPDLTFLMDADGAVWQVTYAFQTGAVSGRRADEVSTEPLSTRRFLTRLHLAHGYPGESSARLFWAVVVDAMALIMVFWGLSGVLMWWQIKATRRVGAVVLLVSLLAAAAAGVGMHEFLSAAQAARLG